MKGFVVHIGSRTSNPLRPGQMYTYAKFICTVCGNQDKLVNRGHGEQVTVCGVCEGDLTDACPVCNGTEFHHGAMTIECHECGWLGSRSRYA